MDIDTGFEDYISEVYNESPEEFLEGLQLLLLEYALDSEDIFMKIKTAYVSGYYSGYKDSMEDSR